MTRCTSSGRAAVNADDAPVPDSGTRPDGQHVDHWVLCVEERAKGFVRPVRKSYQHVGIPGPKYSLRALTRDERRRYTGNSYVKYEEYPKRSDGSPADDSSVMGRFWTQEQLDKVGKGCGVVTNMPDAIAETYARAPGYYGSTFCCGCRQYLPVGKTGEFVWDGTDERVGT